VISRQSYSKAAGIDEARIWIGIVGEHAMTCSLIEPFDGRVPRVIEKGWLAADGAAVARNQQIEEVRIGCQDHCSIFVMPALVAGIHEFLTVKQDVDGRDKPGHDNHEGFRLSDRFGQGDRMTCCGKS